jgi:LytR cell envelope-related transcriptional attenuator
MSRSRARRGGSGGGGGRLQTVGLFLTLLAVAALVGSLAWGLREKPPETTPARPRISAPAPAARVRVEVLNASGRAGLAREATRLLRDAGFDVVHYGNARGFPPDTSLVLDRAGRMDAARQVADALRIRRVVARPDSNLFLDATVVLGRDWQASPPEPGR